MRVTPIPHPFHPLFPSRRSCFCNSTGTVLAPFCRWSRILLRLCIGPSSAARPLSRVGLDRQHATLLRKLRADWTGGLRAIRRRGFSQHGGCGKEQRDEHCKNRGSRGVHRCHFQPSSLNCRDGGARPPAIAYSRVDTGPIPSAVRSSSNLPASHSRLGHGLIAQSC